VAARSTGRSPVIRCASSGTEVFVDARRAVADPRGVVDEADRASDDSRAVRRGVVLRFFLLGAHEMPRVSIVVPTLNEDLGVLLATLGDYLGGLPAWTFDVVFVDDSSDPVRDRAREVVRAVSLPPNASARVLDGQRRGKGHAIGKAVASTRSDLVFLIDADLPAPVEGIGEFLRVLDADPNIDAVIAERPLHRDFTTPMRYVASRGLLLLQRAFVFHSSEFSDTQCGFKAFRGDLIRSIVAEQIIDGGMYDLEYLYITRRRGKRVAKVEVVPSPERRESRIDVWKCLRNDPVDLLRFKLHGVLGRYR
jgi:dolichyl-phosphate beta-glucosyltransferase